MTTCTTCAQLREHLGYTQRQLSRPLGVCTRTIIRWEQAEARHYQVLLQLLHRTKPGARRAILQRHMKEITVV